MARWKVIAKAIILLFLSGCISSPRYPESWDDIPKDSNCKNIAGYFLDRGENLEGYQYSTFNSIYMMLMGGDAGKLPDVKYIQIIQSANVMVLNAFMRTYAGEEWIEQKIIPVETERCEDGLLQIKVPDSMKTYSSEMGLEAYKFYYKIGLAKDGSLIIVRRSYGVGTISIVPAAVTSHRNWFRFKPKEKLE
jgi:hypothetical protein